jgi:hypothetical protein
MTTEDYRRALDAAIREYDTLGQQRQDIDKRLAELAQTIGTLSRLCGLTPTVPMGLTDACRLATRTGLPMTPTDVRARLMAIGFDLSKYSSDLAAIHTVLKRLNEAGELRLIAHGPHGRQYLWHRPPQATGLGPDVAAVVREMEERQSPRTPEHEHWIASSVGGKTKSTTKRTKKTRSTRP